MTLIVRFHCINSLEGKCTLPDITEEYVQKEISSMSVGKATGPDGISVKMLQIASRYIFNPHIQYLDKVRTLPKRLEIRVGHSYS